VYVAVTSVLFFLLTPPKAIGPLFPFTQFTLLNGLLIPVAMYAAIAIVVTIFVFPRTAHSAFLGTVTQLLNKMKLLLDAQEDLLVAVPGSINPGSSKALQLRALRVSMFTIHQGRTFFNIYPCVIKCGLTMVHQSYAAEQIHKRRV
jgi:Putative ER transporter, 6TM, N-terminal